MDEIRFSEKNAKPELPTTAYSVLAISGLRLV